MDAGPRELRPDERRALDEWLASSGHRWPPGTTHLVGPASGPSAVVRLGEPPPGDGYHREHVRTVHALGEPASLERAARVAVAGAGPATRLEAEVPADDEGSCRALMAAGLVEEVRFRGGIARGDGVTDLLLLGRPARRRRDAPPTRSPSFARDELLAGAPRIVVHGPATRRALADFLDSLVPGRAYPPGTLLSDAERAETRRAGDLDARWLLALSGDGRVLGGVIVEPDRRPGRRHVARVHVDVRPESRLRGLAAALFRAARRGLGLPRGARRLEADPRSGNVAACKALERGGFRLAGVQRGAWRMRGPAAAWDEDLWLYEADVVEESSSA